MPNKINAITRKRRKHYIREWRIFRGYTQERLAAMVEMNASSISQLETYKQGYTDETLARLADALQCSPADLLGRDPSHPADRLMRIINGLPPDRQAQAVRVIEALTNDAA